MPANLSAQDIYDKEFTVDAKGYNADSISKELNIAKPTTKTHIQHIYQKLTINSQQALIALINDKS